MDFRIALHKTQASLLLCFVAHHDKAYDWAARRKLDEMRSSMATSVQNHVPLAV